MNDHKNPARNNEALSRRLRQVKRGALKNGAKGKRFRRTVFGSVTCNVHGKEVKGKPGLEVKCAAPATKKERYLGCPACRALRLNAA